jgi:hypothetical protein
MLISAEDAIAAYATPALRVGDTNEIANRDTADIGSARDNPTYRLVTRNTRKRAAIDRITELADIGVADTGRLDLDNHVRGAGARIPVIFV